MAKYRLVQDTTNKGFVLFRILKHRRFLWYKWWGTVFEYDALYDTHFDLIFYDYEEAKDKFDQIVGNKRINRITLIEI